MKFTVLTLFPEMIEQGLRTSILGRAMDKNLIELHTVNIRDYTEEKHGRVDDYTYGGGAGMLMQAQPVYDAWRAATGGQKACRTVYVTPQGRPFNQRMAADFAREDELVILCGHYEGIDDRVLQTVVTDYVSIGDYVLTGGELPAMVLIDAIARLVPGVLHNGESAETESFHRDLLEYPQYSRPEEWRGMRVPEVLLGGNHRQIEEWRLGESVRLTRERRPDLFRKYEEKENLIRRLSSDKRHNIHLMESLRRGRAEILYQGEEAILLYDADAGVYMLYGLGETQAAGTDEANGSRCETERRRLVDLLDERTERTGVCVITSQSYWQPLLEERFGSMETEECMQACYTQRVPLPVKHRDIRRLDASALDYVAAHYDMGSRKYLTERLNAGALVGIYVDNALAGFMGVHREGSLGMLYIEPRYQRGGLASSLEAYCINRQLEQGLTPYGHIIVGNEASLRLQERLGLYMSKGKLWWLTKRVNTNENT